MSPKMLSAEQVDFYRRNGYLHLPSFVSEDMLVRVQQPVKRWVNRIIARWVKKGFITHDFSGVPFDQRLFLAWEAAGKPHYKEYVSEEIVSEETFDFLTQPAFVTLAQELLEGSNIQVLAAFFCRPKSPTWAFPIDTPWHQDAQCTAYHGMHEARMITIWIPFMDVDEYNSCLQLAGGSHIDVPVYEDAKNGTVHYSIHPSISDTFVNPKTLPMKRGDVLCLHDRVAHRALPNKSDRMRWSMDIRYECFPGPDAPLPKRGFICAHTEPSRIIRNHEEAFSGLWDYRGNSESGLVL